VVLCVRHGCGEGVGTPLQRQQPRYTLHRQQLLRRQRLATARTASAAGSGSDRRVDRIRDVGLLQRPASHLRE
jgi:hypothetical protein